MEKIFGIIESEDPEKLRQVLLKKQQKGVKFPFDSNYYLDEACKKIKDRDKRSQIKELLEKFNSSSLTDSTSGICQYRSVSGIF